MNYTVKGKLICVKPHQNVIEVPYQMVSTCRAVVLDEWLNTRINTLLMGKTLCVNLNEHNIAGILVFDQNRNRLFRNNHSYIDLPEWMVDILKNYKLGEDLTLSINFME